MAFVNHGDIFVTSVEYPTTKQIRNHTSGGSSITAGALTDRTLYYSSDRDGHENIYRARIARED